MLAINIMGQVHSHTHNKQYRSYALFYVECLLMTIVIAVTRQGPSLALHAVFINYSTITRAQQTRDITRKNWSIFLY